MSEGGKFCVFCFNHGLLLLYISCDWLDVDTVLYALQVYLFGPKVWDVQTLASARHFVLDVVGMERIVENVVVRVARCGHRQTRRRQFPTQLAIMLPWLSALTVLVASSLYFPFHSNTHVLLDDAGSNTSRILLLTAHPDDECLFFAPTMLALREDPQHPEIYSLTMSVGNADGLGGMRKEELDRSLDVMGIDQDKRWVVDHP